MPFRLLLGTLRAALLVLAIAAPASANQSSVCMPTTGTVSGLQLVGDINDALAAIVSSHSGASAPANDCGAAAVTGQVWLDTAGSDPVLKIYDGTSWLAIAVLDDANHVLVPPSGGGTATVASATTTNLCTNPQPYQSITGTTTITSLGTGCPVGTVRYVSFAAALTLTYNATSLILPTAASITTAAGDKAIFAYLGSGNWTALNYNRASGAALTTPAAFAAQITITGVITPSALSSGANDWNPSGLSSASVIRASASTAVDLTGLTAQPSGTTIYLHNVGSSAITLKDASTSSSAANRLALGADFILAASQAVQLRYDGTLSRWIAVAGYRQAASQAQAEAGTDNAAMMTPLRTAQAIAALSAAAAVDYQVFTASGTWTKPSGLTASSRVLVELWAGGGGGRSAGGGGGGGGGACAPPTWFLASALGSTETVTIGTGGSTNSPGGNTTFGSWLTAYGGAPGQTGNGGGGGGMTSAGSGSTGGGPMSPLAWDDGTGRTGDGSLIGGGDGGGATGSAGQTAGTGGFAIWGGGGGGGGNPSFGNGNGPGGHAMCGGGGGGGDGTATAAGGVSILGGDGGARGVAGTAPGGGGGKGAAGARGEARITVFK